MRRVLGKASGRKVSIAWSAWIWHVVERRRLEFESRARLEKTRKIIGKLRCLKLASALNSWKTKDQRADTFAKLLTRVARGKQASGLFRWKNAVEKEAMKEADQARFLKVTLGRLAFSHLAAGLSTWKGFIEREKEAERKKREAGRLMRRTIDGMTKRGLKKGFVGWRIGVR